MVNGVVICDPSLRMLNVKRQNPLGVPLISAFQVRLFLPPLAHHCLCIVLSQLSWI
jgi:hypothetical protein